MAQIFTMKDITEDGDYLLDFQSGRLSKVFIFCEGILDFIQIKLWDENGDEILNLVPKKEQTIYPRKKVVDFIDSGIYDSYIIHGNMKLSINGMTEDTILKNMIFYFD